MANLKVTRLLQNPLGAPAPAGEPGDIVSVTDGSVTIYLSPAEFDHISDQQLRWLLARGPRK